MDVFEVYNKIFKKYFPNLRNSQKEILEQYESIRDSVKIVEIEAPVGTGKSLINMIIALSEDTEWNNIFKKIVISSFTKVLQKQYVESFGEILRNNNISYSIGLGVQSFICKLLKKSVPFCLATLGYYCRYFPKIYEGSFKELVKLLAKDSNIAFFGRDLPFALKNTDTKIKALSSDIKCFYFQNEYNVYNSKVIFANHHYLISHLLHSKSLPYPSVLIIDEYHTFPKTFSDMNSIKLSDNLIDFLEKNDIISRETLLRFISYSNYPEFLDFVLDMKDVFNELLQKTKGSIRVLLANFLSRIEAHKILLEVAQKEQIPIERIFILNASSSSIYIIPTYFAHLLFIKYLSSFVEKKIILCSATIPPKKYSAGEVRLYSDTDMYLPFLRPIIYVTDAPEITNTTILSKKVQEYIINLIKSLWTYDNFRKIVIHSVNNFIRDYLGSLLKKAGFPVIITEDLKKDFEKWKNMKEGIIISAGLEEGVDLKYDIARIQIIIKLPLYDLYKDSFMKFLSKYEKELFNYYIALRLAQISGRICRARDDVGVTLILDRRAISHLKKYSHLYPKFYKVAVKMNTTGASMAIIKQLDIIINKIKAAKYKYKNREIPKDELMKLIGMLPFYMKRHFLS